MLSLVLVGVLQASTTEVEAEIVAASLFKNGYAVVLREAPINSAAVRVTNPPTAVLGTLWLGTSPGITIDSATFRRVTTTSTRPVNNLQEVLEANTGKTLNFIIPSPDGGQHSITGVLYRITPEIAVVKAEGTDMVIPRSWILAITSTTDEIIYDVETSSTIGVVDVVASAGTGKLYFLTLEPGLTWAPSYRVELDESTMQSTLTLRSTIMNDLADISGINLQLVTGFPNVPYINVRDPFTSGSNIMQWANELNAGPGVSPADMMQNIAARRGEATGGLGGFEMLPPTNLDGTRAGELFFYPQNNVNLARGERGYYTLFQTRSPFRRTYAAQLVGGAIQPVSRGGGGFGIQLDDRPEDVWYEVIFPNNSNYPLTTAAATIYQNGELVGQDTMEYMPAGAEVRLRITKALDVRISQTLEELSRERGAMTIRTTSYDLIQVEGVISIRNLKPEEIDVEIMRRFDGIVLENDPSGETRQIPVGTTGVNPVTIATWKLSVPANSITEIKYQYSYYQAR